jgi:hypothetical protein
VRRLFCFSATSLFLGDFDGEFSQLMADLAGHAGPVFDTIFEHVDNPPSTPVADHAEAFVEWTAAHLVHPLNIYTAYPDVTAKEIKALASTADVSGAGEQRPFLVILPIKSRVAFVEVQLLLRVVSAPAGISVSRRRYVYIGRLGPSSLRVRRFRICTLAFARSGQRV